MHHHFRASKYLWVLLLVCSISSVANAWTTPIDISGSVQVSGSSDITAVLTEGDDSQELVVQNIDGKKIWSYNSGAELNTIALSKDGNYIAAVGNGVRLLSVSNKKKLWEWTTDGRDAVGISNDGTWIVAGGYTGKVYLFKKDSSKPVKTWDLGKREDSPRSAVISDDGKTIAASTNQNVYLFKNTSTTPEWSAKTEEQAKRLLMTNNGRYLLGVSTNSIYLWDTKNSKPVWSKKWKGSLIGAAMSATGDKIVVSNQKGISIFDNKGNELRSFSNDFGNSDVAMSANGRYIYVNTGHQRLYSFDDSYSTSEMRPFRITQSTNAGGQERVMTTSAAGNVFTYPQQDEIHIEKSNPAILVSSPGIPILVKDVSFDMSTFVTNPSVSSMPMTVSVSMGTAANEWWSKLTSKLSDREPASIKSKLISYAVSELTGNSTVHTENMTLAAGTSKASHFSITVPDLEQSGSSFSDSLANGMSNLSPMAIVGKILDKIKGPLSKLIGNDAANLAVGITNKTISAGTGQVSQPILGMGTVTLYDARGNTLDQDSFYFMYLK